MAKKKSKRKPKTTTIPVVEQHERCGQPPLFEPITRSIAKTDYASQGAAGLYLCHPSTRPYQNPEGLIRIDCLPYREKALLFQDDPCIWAGVGETTLRFIIQDWMYRTGVKCKPNFYRISLPAMLAQEAWALQHGATFDR